MVLYTEFDIPSFTVFMHRKGSPSSFKFDNKAAITKFLLLSFWTGKDGGVGNIVGWLEITGGRDITKLEYCRRPKEIKLGWEMKRSEHLSDIFCINFSVFTIT